MNRWSARERRWRDALMAALIPVGPPNDGRPEQDPAGRLPGLAELDTTSFWADLDQAAPPLLRLGLRVAVWALTWMPLVLVGRLCTFPRLSPDAQDQLLSRAAASRWYLLRQLVTLLKALACFAYFREPAVRARFGPNDEPAGPAGPQGGA